MNNLSTLEPNRSGLVHLYTGTGKGKTTAAIGLAVRFAGTGGRVLFCQFLKATPSGELEPLEKLGVTVVRPHGSKKFIFQMTPEERQQEMQIQRECFEHICRMAADASAPALLVLDEVVDAVNCAMISLDELCSFLQQRPPSLEVVLTGRNPPDVLCKLADYHTDFVCLRHPYETGVAARRGVEF